MQRPYPQRAADKRPSSVPHPAYFQLTVTLLIAGEKAGSLWHTEKLDKLIGCATKKVVAPNGTHTHMDFYDQPEYMNEKL